MPEISVHRIDEKRIEAAIQRESLRRLGMITWARSIAMIAVFGLIATIVPWPSMLYYQALVGLFILSGIFQYFIGKSRWQTWWLPYLFVAVDMALLVFALISPNPLARDFFPPQFTLRFGSFLYLFLLVGVLAMTLRPALSLWGGLCGAVFWAVGVWWLTTLPGSDFEELTPRSLDGYEPTREEIVRRILDPLFIDLGVEFQNIVILLIVSVMLSLAIRAARRLVVRETAQARWAANLSRYLPSEAISSLANRDNPFEEEREAYVAVLFTDVVGFSTYAENRTAHDVIGLLREVHALVAHAVFEHHGVVDKFIGDGAMATFGLVPGAPDTDAETMNPAAQALYCTRAIITAMQAWNDARRADGHEEIQLSVGVHYGPVIVGDVGSDRRMELAVIGDTVNVAARLEHMTRALKVSAAVSDETVVAAGYDTGFETLGPHPIKGRAEPVVIWSLPQRNSGSL